MSLTMEPIGVISTSYHDVRTTPIQSLLNPEAHGRILVDRRFIAGLQGLDRFDYAYLITVLATERKDDPAVLQPTPLLLQGTGRRVGVFATRFPIRPNSIGLSLVRILAVGRATVDFSGVDMVDGTPVLDIKPWLPAFDAPAEAGKVRSGWYGGLELSIRKEESDGTERKKPAEGRDHRRQVRRRDGGGRGADRGR